MKKKTIIILIILITIIATIFLINKIQREKRKYDIENISEYRYFVVKEDLYGVIDKTGNKIIDAKYSNIVIPNPEKSVFICYENNNITKVFNQNNEEIFTQYKNIEPLRLKNIAGDLVYEKSVLKYKENDKYGIIDFNGKRITKAIYDEIDTLQYKEGELIVKQNEKYGIISLKGVSLVQIKYDKIEADKFYDEAYGYKKAGYIVANKTEEGYRYGYVNLDGKEILSTKYNDLFRITAMKGEDVYLICAENGKYGMLKNNKQIIDSLYQSISYSESANILTALKGKKYGIISIEGDIIIPFEYSKPIDIIGENIYVKDDKENVLVYTSKGEKSTLTENQAIINIQNTNYKLYIETKSGKTTYSLYNNDAVVTKNKYTYIQYLFDNYFIVANTNGMLGIIDNDERIVIPFDYNSIQMIENTKMIQTVKNSTENTEIYTHNMVKICELKNATIEINKDYIKLYNSEESKYISNSEKELTNTEIFSNNKIFAKKLENKWGFVDFNGNTVVDFIYDYVTEVNEYGFAGIKENGKWGVIGSQGKVIVEPEYNLNENEPVFIGIYHKVIYGNGEIYYTK